MQLITVAEELDLLYRDLINAQFKNRQIAESLPSSYRMSGINLLHYLTMRSRDLRKVHDLLSDYGLSGLRNSESYVLRNLTDVLRLIHQELGKDWEPYADIASLSYQQAKKQLRRHCTSLLGKVAAQVKTHIIIDAHRKRLSTVVESIEQWQPSMVHFDLMRCGYDRSLAAIESIKSKMPPTKRPTIICSLQGRRILIDTRVLQDDPSGSKRKRRLTIQVGDHLAIDNKARYGALPKYGDREQLLSPAIAPTQLRDTPLEVSPGDLVMLDGDRVESRVIEADKYQMVVVITKCQGGQHVTLSRYAEVWLPYKRGQLLSPADQRNIDSVLAATDILCVGGLDHPQRIRDLVEELGPASDQLSKLVLRVDHPDIVRSLPLSLLEAMKHFEVGVWLDGDRLYSEVGPARLPELQDQVAWIAEAAHVPMLYGMPLLTTMSKLNRPSRAELVEIVDATRAEAVLLAHDKWIDMKYEVLHDILSRTEKHYSKRKAQMRALSIAKDSLTLLTVD